MSDRKPQGSPGYTFPLMLVIITALAYGASRIEVAASYRLKRDKEDELLFRGLAYMKAIDAFHTRNGKYPRRLAELAGSGAGASGFIRQLYKDPVTGKDFDLIRTSEGEITGVVSSSAASPFRKVDFEKGLRGFELAKTYAEWRFTARTQPAKSQPGNSEIAPLIAATSDGDDSSETD
ncbi:hypothetical protein Rvan_1815 [Rhodomicrobium vannielii ATCC 17100]|uniref:Type II secretion system protein n=2 Tax=Rhodomicrobium vannielii TaxID=1069 RepID=E3HZM2_RHOVT|nr:hypothetical protein Rvan_1815 [Rhodomicrobium vannielii ATCC 17100]